MVTRLAWVVLMVCFAAPAQAEAPKDAVFLDGGGSGSALILCHGRGKHPRWRVVDPLRKGVHEKLGWHTLSLQIPADDKNWREYAEDFPEAFARIRKAIAFLRQEKGVESVYLMGHSMGARMLSAFVAENPDAPIEGLVVAGVRNNGGYPFDGRESLRRLAIPVLDIWGDGGNGKDARNARARATLRSDRYSQLAVPDANHKFVGYEQAFVDAVVGWLKNR